MRDHLHNEIVGDTVREFCLSHPFDHSVKDTMELAEVVFRDVAESAFCAHKVIPAFFFYL